MVTLGIRFGVFFATCLAERGRSSKGRTFISHSTTRGCLSSPTFSHPSSMALQQLVYLSRVRFPTSLSTATLRRDTEPHIHPHLNVKWCKLVWTSCSTLSKTAETCSNQSVMRSTPHTFKADTLISSICVFSLQLKSICWYKSTFAFIFHPSLQRNKLQINW